MPWQYGTNMMQLKLDFRGNVLHYERHMFLSLFWDLTCYIILDCHSIFSEKRLLFSLCCCDMSSQEHHFLFREKLMKTYLIVTLINFLIYNLIELTLLI
jgi:hypothetical protein